MKVTAPAQDAVDRTFPAAEARARFSGILSTVTYKKERVSITWHGKIVAAMVPAEDLKLLEELEDASDVRAAKLAIREARRKGALPLDKVLRRFRAGS
ncbi:MAG TPA: type II toxin-antitoxin system prevent-host-death family antitoxin [Candidatus Binataceae bacterium]|nr:type II toxin-antitoxin system prevent-host-death family antitoxin [Candidatus Binataceae bacterium]